MVGLVRRLRACDRRTHCAMAWRRADCGEGLQRTRSSGLRGQAGGCTMSTAINRREFLILTLAGAGAALQDTTRVGRLYDAQRAGRPQTPVTAADNDKSIQA